MPVRARELAPFRALSAAQRDRMLASFERSLHDIAPHRAARLNTIVRRNIFGRVAPSQLIDTLGISRQQFFADRREAFRRLRALAEAPSTNGPATVFGPSQFVLTQARALYRAGKSRRAVELLEQIDGDALDSGDYFDVLRLLTDALDDTNALTERADGIAQRARRWAERNEIGSPPWRLARAAEQWMRTRFSIVTTGYRRDFFRHIDESVGLVRSTNGSRDRATTIALCRMLIESVPLLINVGDPSAARAAIGEVRTLLRRTDLSSTLEAEAQAMSAQAHWFDRGALRMSRAERQAAYRLAIANGQVRTAWSCLYFEIRDQLLQHNGKQAVVLAEDFFRSVHASDAVDWHGFSQATLVNAYLAAGRLADAERYMTPPHGDDNVPARMLARCGLESARKDYSAVYQRASELVAVFERRGLALSKASALQFRARAGHALGFATAMADIEEAVAIGESRSAPEPLMLRSLYEDAAEITRRPRYRDAVHDMLSESRPVYDPLRDGGGRMLTQRQLDVARLAACGLTNEAIARELTMSPRTVETHLSAIFSRFEIRSRRQIEGVLHAPGSKLVS